MRSRLDLVAVVLALALAAGCSAEEGEGEGAAGSGGGSAGAGGGSGGVGGSAGGGGSAGSGGGSAGAGGGSAGSGGGSAGAGGGSAGGGGAGGSGGSGGAAPCVARAAPEWSVRVPPPLALPPAGQTFVDPTYGTTILRLTDESAGGQATHEYGYWSPLNATSTRLHVEEAGTEVLYDFDPATMAAVRVGPLFPAGAPCAATSSSWSHTDPDLLFCLGTRGPKALYAFDVAARTFDLVHDFDREIPDEPELYLWQMGVDGADELFTFHTRRDGSPELAIAYERSSDTVQLRDYVGQGLDETHVDHAGRYVVVLRDSAFDYWDVRTGSVVTAHEDEVERGGLCHQATGSGIDVGGDCWETGWLARDLDDPLRPRHLMSFLRDDGSANWGYDLHLSLNHRDESYFISSIYSAGRLGTDGWQPWENELVAVATDGSWLVRLAHHRTVHADYYDSPRASSSYDGRFVVYTSNFEGSRRDVFVLKMPELCR